MKRRPTGVPCPSCFSTDTWRWHRETGVMRYMAAAFSLTMLTCRACGKRFYTRTAPDEVEPRDAESIPREVRRPRNFRRASRARVSRSTLTAPPAPEMVPELITAVSVGGSEQILQTGPDPVASPDTLVFPAAPALPPPALVTAKPLPQEPALAPPPEPANPKPRGFRVRVKIRLGRSGGFRAAS